LESEVEVPRPLTDDEVKQGIAHLVAEAVYDKLNTSGTLFGRSFPKFKTSEPIQIKLLLDRSFIAGPDFGDDAMVDNHQVSISGEVGESPVLVEVKVDIPAMPPNAFRQKTGQPVKVLTKERGQTVEKSVKKYQPRPKGKTK
jgi:hypothetical protein